MKCRVTSAASIFKHIDRRKYEPIRDPHRERRLVVVPAPRTDGVERRASDRAGARRRTRRTTTSDPALGALKLDVVFPVLHGPYGEDGTIQGLLEMAGLAYVGNGVLASAAGMDKSIMKVLFAGRGLPVCRSHGFVRPEWDRNRNAMLQHIGALGLPVFVKPANLGSSVGISKVKTPAELVPAIELALQFDRKDRRRSRVAARERSNAPCSATTIRRPRCLARSCRRGSSTTTRPNISMKDPRR